MAIDTYDKLIAAFQDSQSLLISKLSIINQLAGGLTSLWRATGDPAQGAIPAAAAVCTKDTLGALRFVNPSAGLESNVGGLSLAGTISHLFFVYDRLSHMGGLNGTVTTAQTVNLTIPPNRNAAVDGSDVDWFVEIYTDIGTTAVTATVAYIDQTDTARTTTISLGSTSFNRAGRMSKIMPNPGQFIKSITSITHATTGTAGNYGVTCAKQVLAEPMGQPNIGIGLDFAQAKMNKVANDACLWMALNASGATSGDIRGALTLIQG
jgi:hypothetical protein